MAENTLADIVKGSRQAGAGVASALGTGIKERLKEKLDPRKFINQSGLMTALFPSLKAYQSKVGGGSDKLSPVRETPKALSLAVADTQILAKNMMVLPAIHKDFNLMRQNLAKLVKLKGGTATTKVDKDFFKSKERTAAYKEQTTTSPTPEQPKTNRALDILKIMGAIGIVGIGLKLGLEYVGDKIKEGIADTLNTLPKTLSDILKSLFSTPKSPKEASQIGSSAIDYMQSEGLDKLLTPKLFEQIEKTMKKWQSGELGESDVDTTDPFGTNSEGTSPTRVTGGEIVGTSEDIAAARANAESYLGRGMTDNEWNALINTTKAESARDSTSYAMVMASILNRARDGTVRHGPNKGKKYSEMPEPVVAAVWDPFQFEAVTGSKENGFKPSANFTRAATKEEIGGLNYAAINILPKVSNKQVNFTATNLDAYKGEGHNTQYLEEMKKTGGSAIAGTQFNTIAPAITSPTVAQAPAPKTTGAAVEQSSQNLKQTRQETQQPQPVVAQSSVPVQPQQSDAPVQSDSKKKSEDLFKQLMAKAVELYND